jgi:tetratricopeptide (TPR) repeat protein
MIKAIPVVLAGVSIAFAQGNTTSDFKIALPDHKGQLLWSAEGFKIVESSAKPNGNEISIRGKDVSGRLTFLGFLFLFPDLAPLTSAKCREGVLDPEKKSNRTFKLTGGPSEIQSDSLPVSVVSYIENGGRGKTEYRVRAFVATGDICGDLEIYSEQPINIADPDTRKILSSYRLDERYVPGFKDALLYAQILYDHRLFKAAAPIFETALERVSESSDPDAKTMRRVITDEEGMAYGISGDIGKARSIFQKAITDDPDYPMYYYNLACADAEEKKLSGARNNLQKAFDRRKNVLPGEQMPDPTVDDSFTPYRNNKEFWAFLQQLETGQ